MITQKELSLLVKHILLSRDFGSEGTFNKYNEETGEYNFDNKEYRKVEKILVSESEQEYGLNTEEVDLISANLINERNPVCYGKDARWANHLYPVYLTETFIKSKYLSNEYFINLF